MTLKRHIRSSVMDLFSLKNLFIYYFIYLLFIFFFSFFLSFFCFVLFIYSPFSLIDPSDPGGTLDLIVSSADALPGRPPEEPDA